MNHRLRTSTKTEALIAELTATTHHAPNVLMRLAVGFSLRDPAHVTPASSGKGLEFNRSTLTGDYDFIYKALITQHLQQPLSDEAYFPSYFLAHAERGMPLVANEYKYAGNKETFIMNLLQLEE